MKKTRKLTEDQLVSEMPATEQPIPATQSEITQASAQVAQPVEPQPVQEAPAQVEAPSNASSVPVNPLRPPVDGMIPTGWAYPDELAQALALDTGNVDVAGTAPDATVTPAPQPAEAPAPVAPETGITDDMFESTKEIDMETKTLNEADEEFKVEDVLSDVEDVDVEKLLKKEEEPVEAPEEEPVEEEEPEVDDFGEIKVSDDELDALLAKIPDALDDLIAGVEDNVEDFKAELGIEDAPVEEEEPVEDEVEPVEEEPVEEEPIEEEDPDLEPLPVDEEEPFEEPEPADPFTGRRPVFDEKRLRKVKALREARKARATSRIHESEEETILRERQLRRARINARRKMAEMEESRRVSFREQSVRRPVRVERRVRPEGRLSERELRRVRAQRFHEEAPVKKVFRPMHDVQDEFEDRRLVAPVRESRVPARHVRVARPRFHEEAPRRVRQEIPAEEKSRLARERLLNEARKAKAMKLQNQRKFDESTIDTSKLVFPKGTTQTDSKIIDSVKVEDKLVKTTEGATSLGERIKENQKETLRIPGITDHNEKFNEALKGTMAVATESKDSKSWQNNRFDEKHQKDNTLNWKKLMSEGMFG